MRDLDAFDCETLPWMSELRGVARRFAGRRDLAEDLVQETYLRALAARHRYQPGTNARAWLHAILANTAYANYRREKRDQRFRERLADEPVEAPAARPGGRIDPTGRSALAMLATLPDPLRSAVELVDVRGLSYLEAAAALRCPIGTVMSRLHRGRRRLRTQLEAAEAESNDLFDTMPTVEDRFAEAAMFAA